MRHSAAGGIMVAGKDTPPSPSGRKDEHGTLIRLPSSCWAPRWPSPSWRSFIRSPAAHHHSPPLKPLGQQVDGQGDEPCQGNLDDMEPHEPSPLLYALSHAAGPSLFSQSSSAPTKRLLASAQGTPCVTHKRSRQGPKKPSTRR